MSVVMINEKKPATLFTRSFPSNNNCCYDSSQQNGNNDRSEIKNDGDRGIGILKQVKLFHSNGFSR
jgi:hypothetical protein